MVNKVLYFIGFRTWAASIAAVFLPSKHLWLRGRKKALLVACSALLLGGMLSIDTDAVSRSIVAEDDTANQHEPIVDPATAPQPEAQEVAPQNAPESKTSSSISTRVQIHASSSNGVGSQTTSVTHTENGQTTHSITRESQDGTSSVNFEVETGSDAEVEIRERGGRLRVDIRDESEF